MDGLVDRRSAIAPHSKVMTHTTQIYVAKRNKYAMRVSSTMTQALEVEICDGFLLIK